MIPRTVKEIHQTTFKRCSNLTNVEFSTEIEALVSSEAMLQWWNQGVHCRCLSTYCFLMKHSIPSRLSLVRVQSWQANLYEMLRCIPTIHPEGMNNYFRSVKNKLVWYESLKDSPALLELAIWKSQILQQRCWKSDPQTTDTRKKRRIDSLWMVTIIVRNVLSYL